MEARTGSIGLTATTVLWFVLAFREATWAKVTKTLSNGATAASVYGTLLSSVLVAVGLFALNF